jgi:hypothetical protein
MPILPPLPAGSEAIAVDVAVLGQSVNFISIEADKNVPIRKLVSRIHEKFRDNELRNVGESQFFLRHCVEEGDDETVLAGLRDTIESQPKLSSLTDAGIKNGSRIVVVLPAPAVPPLL